MRVIAGRYQLLAPLGAGGAGTVWRARDEVLHREVAVKEVRLPQGDGRALAVIDTLREARAAAALNHPSIITVHDVIDEGGQPWIIMDLLSGGSLADRLRQWGPLHPGHVATVGLRVLDALEAAHRRGILHRDVKPGNVIITDGGEAVLTDFGIAASTTDRVTPESAQAAAQYGNVAGSPGFVAPERLRGEQAGPASDLWSLGATLYAAAEGRAPFERESPMAVIASVLTAQPAPPVNAGPLAGLIMAMLAKDPAQRPHPATIRATLGQLATPLPVRATQNLAPSTVPVQAKKKSKAPLVLASAAVVLAVGVTSFVLLNRQEEVRPTPTPSGTVVAEASDPPPPTTQAPPSTQPPKGDGKFATSPPSCDLLTDEQAQQVLPRSHSQQDQAYDDTACNWLAGINNPSITVTVKMAGSVAAARQVYDNTLRSRRAKVQPEGKSQVYPVELLKGTGEQAFVQSQQETYFNSSTSTAWLRVSNVVVSVKFYVSSNPKAADQLKVAAVKAAAFVADNLQKAT